MAKAKLSALEVKEMLAHVSKKMIESKDRLTEADRAIGDGDHGIGLARGFESVLKRVAGQDPATIEQLFDATGLAILTSSGGAAGAVFGTFFRGAAANLKNQEILTAEIFSRMLQDGLRAVKDRGKAKPGDKTMIDALEPAAMESKTKTSATLDEALAAIAEAARRGMEKTKEMVAAVGKARTLGERSLGYPDPGAISTYLILNFMKEYVCGLSCLPSGF